MIDKDTILSDSQALTTTADSETVLDLGALVDDRGTALVDKFGIVLGNLILDVSVVTAFAGGTNIQTSLHDSADDSTFATTEIVTADIVTASLVAGYKILSMPLPKAIKRYIKLVYTISGTYTAGAVHAALRMGRQT